MANAYKCDVCGTLYEGRKYIPDVTIEIYRRGDWSKYLDLCPECQDKLVKFIHYKENFCSL